MISVVGYLTLVAVFVTVFIACRSLPLVINRRYASGEKSCAKRNKKTKSHKQLTRMLYNYQV